MNKTKFDDPQKLFFNGFMKINYIAKLKSDVVQNDDKLINLKCNQVEADICFKLYRSPLPDLYEMRSFGNVLNYYGYWSYDPGSEEFNNLIDGQTFEFHDQVFGTDFKLTKNGNKWEGNNYCIHTTSVFTKKNKAQPVDIYIQKTDIDKAVMKVLLGRDDINPLQAFKDNGMLVITSSGVLIGEYH